MKFDRNTIIGFVLLALLFFGFFYFNNKEQAANKQRLAIQDSINKANKAATKVNPDTTTHLKDTTQLNATQETGAAGEFQKRTGGIEQISKLENDLIKV